MRTEADIRELLYSGRRDLDAVLASAHEITVGGGTVYGAVFGCERPFAELSKWLRRGDDNGIHVGQKSPHLIRFEVEAGSLLPKGAATAQCVAWEDPAGGLVFVLASQGREWFNVAQMRLHQELAPELSRIFVRTNEFRRAFERLADEMEVESIRVREYVARGLIDDEASVKRVETQRDWTDKEFPAVFESLASQSQWLSSVRLEIRGPECCSGKIWRNATFACYGNFRFFFQTVVNSIVSELRSSRKFFQHRGQVDSPTKLVRPLKIAYGGEVFSDKRQNQRLIDVLRGLANAAVSVVHSNPYLHASVLDYSDGSSYELWVSSTTEILVVPNRKATVESLSRLCEHICNEFEEGEIIDFSTP